MPARTSTLSTVSASTAAMFDVLSDGQWHPTATVIAAGTAECARTERDDALRNGQRVRRKALDNGVVVPEEALVASGAQDLARNRLMIAVRGGRVEKGLHEGARQHRMVADTCSEWASLRGQTGLDLSAIPDQAAAASSHSQQQADVVAEAVGTMVVVTERSVRSVQGREAVTHVTTDTVVTDTKVIETTDDAHVTTTVTCASVSDTLREPLPVTDQAAGRNDTGEQSPVTVESVTATTASGRVRRPLVFGGIAEERGFEMVPLTARDRVHFRIDKPLPLAAFTADLPEGVTVTLDEGEGLYRVEGACGRGEAIADFVRAWCEVYGHRTIGLRAEYNVKRRDLRDLPERFLSDLATHYGPFSLKRLQRHMATIRMHIPDSDDIAQQSFEWILEAVARYDETKGVPFGAFLVGSLSKWVHDLNRNAYGRTTADAEHKHHKAVTAFIGEHQRRPNDRELAEIMGQDVQTVRRNAQTISTLQGLRNVQSIDGGPDDVEIPIPATEQAPDEIMSQVDQSLLSQALTQSCAPDAEARGRAAQPNVLGWATWYATTWGGSSKTALSARLGTSMRNMNVHADRAQQRMQASLESLRG